MPVVLVAATRLFQGFVSKAVRSKIYGGSVSPGYSRLDLNTGQRAKLESLHDQIVDAIEAEAEVNIAGRDVDVKMDWKFDIDQLMPDYLCDVGDMLLQEVELFADKLESGRGRDSGEIIKQGFQGLG
jgi:hypothetical protein